METIFPTIKAFNSKLNAFIRANNLSVLEDGNIVGYCFLSTERAKRSLITSWAMNENVVFFSYEFGKRHINHKFSFKMFPIKVDPKDIQFISPDLSMAVTNKYKVYIR